MLESFFFFHSHTFVYLLCSIQKKSNSNRTEEANTAAPQHGTCSAVTRGVCSAVTDHPSLHAFTLGALLHILQKEFSIIISVLHK